MMEFLRDISYNKILFVDKKMKYQFMLEMNEP